MTERTSGAHGRGAPELVEIQPCTEEGLVTLEAWLGGRECEAYFDPRLLCRLLLASPVFERIRCSDEMGYGIAERETQRVHVFKSGKLIVRRAPGKERALALLELTGRCLWGARLCSSARPLLDELLLEKGWESCRAELGSPPGCSENLGPPARELGTALELARKLPNWSGLASSLDVLRGLADEMARGLEPEERSERFRRAEVHILDFVSGAPLAEAATGLVFLSLSLSLDRAACALDPLLPDDRKGIWEAMAEVLEAIASGRSGEANRLREIILEEAKGADVEPAPLLAPINLLSVRLP